MIKKAVRILIAIVAGVTVAGYILYLSNTAPAVPTIAAADIASANKPIVVKLHAQWCPQRD